MSGGSEGGDSRGLRRPWRRLGQHAKDDAGQMMPELALVIPAFALAVVLIVNILSFVSECARFDRVADEVARVAASDQRGPSESTQLLQEALGYQGGKRGPYQAQVQAQVEGLPGLQNLRLTFTLKYRVFASASGAGGLGAWRRTKTVVVAYCQPLLEL
ncbi:MAG: hypothetical protein FWD65_06145 [Coriobacteriia bacterium]|nr:hypothetical protein [Coriobacteriia bacterium]